IWKAIGVKVEGEDRGQPGAFDAKLVWHDYNGYPKIQIQVFKQPEFVQVNSKMPLADNPFNPNDMVTSGIDEVIFPWPSAISADPDQTDLKFTPLVETSKRAGTISIEVLSQLMNRDDPNVVVSRERYTGKYTLAARIQGKETSSKKDGDK